MSLFHNRYLKQAAIFDMDGLLLDTERLYQRGFVEVAKQLGFVPDPAFPQAIAGTSGATAYQTILAYYPEADAPVFWDMCVERVARQLEQHVPKMPGVDAILAYFHEQGVKLGVASSSPHAQIETYLQRAEIFSYFTACVSGEEVLHGKPAPDIFLETARRLGCAPQDCYVFEDGVQGARAGIAAGCATIMIPDLIQPTDDLRANCLWIGSSLTEARQWIAQREQAQAE